MNDDIRQNTIDPNEYTTYSRRFFSYKWYKPVLVGLITWIIAVVVVSGIALVFSVLDLYNVGSGGMLASGYDDLDVSSVRGVVLNLGGLAILIPGLMIAGKIVGDRPFSSYSSSRGGWNWKLFFKCILICLVVIGIPVVISNLKTGGDGINRFTAASFVALTIMGPLQCVAEEYLFRAFLIQTVGGWFKIPAVAIIASAVVFAMGHPYNTYGVASVLVSGLIWGVMVKVTKGLEASSAAHIVNNMAVFYMMGMGTTTLSADLSAHDMIVSVAKDLAYLAVILFIALRLHWFDEIQRDDVAPFNARVEAKIAAKEAKKMARQGENGE